MTKRMAMYLAGIGCLILLSQIGSDEMATGAEDSGQKKVLRHVVMFKFKDSATEEQVQHVVDEFKALPKKIDVIRDFEYGTDVSTEDHSHGFTHCFLVTFRDEKGRDEYLPHPAHQEFVKTLRPILDDVLVLDYWVQR